MYRKATMALAVAAALGLPHAATAQTQDELRTLREQVRQLDRRVTDAEQAAIQASSRPASERGNNPAVSVILNGIYSNLSQDPSGFKINGFAPTLGDVGPGKRGLSLGESELALAANIDHHFRGTLIASISPEDTIGVEEGYIEPVSLSYGFTIKAGRFFSAVGYQNQIHAHAWDFTDAPLANKVFLGNQLNEDGIQLKWVAPTSLYWDVGVEAGRGRQFPAGPAGGRNKNGVSSGNVFTHIGGDLGTGTAWQTGLSYLSTSPQDRTFDDLDSTGTGTIVTNSFSGTSRLWVLDGILKWAPNYNPTYTNFKLQGEFFRRKENGNLTYDTTAASLGTQTGGVPPAPCGFSPPSRYHFVPLVRGGYLYYPLDAGTPSHSPAASRAPTATEIPTFAQDKPTPPPPIVDCSATRVNRLHL